MKKLIYKDEKINIVIVVIISLFYLFIIPFVYVIVKDNEAGIAEIIFAVFWVLLVTYFLYQFLKFPIKTRKKFKMIKENGTKYSGYIESFNYDAYTKSTSLRVGDPPNWRKFKEFTLNVSYTIDGVKKTYTTPILGFNPIKDLSSRNCNVYIYNHQLYVTDYEVNNDGTYHVWAEDSEEVRDVIEKDKRVNAEYNGIMKYSLIIFLLFVVVSIIISLLVNLKS